jgi:hypothetical protein
LAFEKWNAQPFLTIESVTNTISLVVANGLITLSAVTLTLSLFEKVGRVRLITALGAAILVFGLLLSAAAFMPDPWLTQWVTGPTILSYCAWCLLVANRLDRREPAR